MCSPLRSEPGQAGSPETQQTDKWEHAGLEDCSPPRIAGCALDLWSALAQLRIGTLGCAEVCLVFSMHLDTWQFFPREG